MGGGTLDFILGAAVIALPQYKIPVVVGTASITLLRKIKNKRSAHKKLGRDPGHASSFTTGGSTRQQVNLQFTDVRCSITNKKGGKKIILTDIIGTAKPGRCQLIHWYIHRCREFGKTVYGISSVQLQAFSYHGPFRRWKDIIAKCTGWSSPIHQR